MRKQNKQQPLGICDMCISPIPRPEWYTSKGLPRLHCSIDCKNMANSRRGSHIRSEKTRQRMREGRWTNPAEIRKPSFEALSQAASIVRKQEVAEGRWRNPALLAKAREKLSLPRLHDGALHQSMEKLRHGKMTDLSEDERSAYLHYRQKLREARRDELNQQARERYRRKMNNLTDDEREAIRAKWRKQNKKKKSG